MRNPAPFDGASERPANLEWRDSAEAACLRKRRRFPEFSLMFLPDFLLADLGVPPEKGPKDSFLSGDSEAASLESVWPPRAGTKDPASPAEHHGTWQ